MELLTKTTHQQALKFNFKAAWKCYAQNHFFITYTLINFFMPLLLSFIGACISDYGTLIVIVIGLTSSFFSVFNQLSILSSIAVSIQRIQVIGNCQQSGFDLGSQVRANTIACSLVCASIYGAIMTGLFVMSCSLYTCYSSTYQNLNNFHNGTIDLGLKFIGVSCPTIIIGFLSNIFLIEIFINNGSFKPTAYLIGITIIQLLLATVLGLNTNLNIVGLGLGVLIGNILGIILYAIDCLSTTNIFKLHAKVQRQELANTFKNTAKFSSRYIFGTILKSFLVLGIGLGLNLASRDTMGAMYLARIIWYYIMYTCGCFGDAILLQANFIKALYHNQLDKTIELMHFQKFQISLVAIVEFFILLGACLLIPYVANIYMQNSGVIANMFVNVDNNGWVINSWLNIPYTNNGLMVGEPMNQIQSNGYVPHGSTTMIYLTIFLWTLAMTKIMTFSTFYSKKEKKANIAMAYITPFVITMYVATMGLATKDLQGTVGNFFFGFQGFSFALMTVGLLLFSMGIMAIVKSSQFIKSDKFLEMHNQYVTVHQNLSQKA